MNSVSLNQLKDIHLPAPISLWPWAPGWYILLLLILLFLLLAAYWLYKKVRKQQLINRANDELKHITDLYSRSPTNAIAQISTLLKRVAMKAFGRKEIAALTGNEWLMFLDKTGQTQQFSQGIGRVLITGPYQQHIDCDFIELTQLIKSWIKKVLTHV